MMTEEMPLCLEISNIVPNVAENVLISAKNIILPIYILSDIRVQCERLEELTVLKRIILEAALEMESLESSDIEEITGISAAIAGRQLAILERAHLLETYDHRTYAPIRDKVISSIESQAYPVRYQRNLSFIYLPDTDDLLAFDVNLGGLHFRNILKMKSHLKYPSPFPNETDLNVFVNKKIKEGDIANLPNDVMEVSKTPRKKKVPGECPAYLCKGTLEEKDGGRVITIDILDKDEIADTCQIVLPEAKYFMAKWEHVIGLLDEATFHNQLWNLLDLENDEQKKLTRNNCNFNIELNNNDLRQVMEKYLTQDRTLAEPFGLLIITDDGTKYEFKAQFSPSDEEGQKEFAFSEMIRDIQRQKLLDLNWDNMRCICHAVSEKYCMNETAPDNLAMLINGRLWHQKRYSIIYKLRESEDFKYE